MTDAKGSSHLKLLLKRQDNGKSPQVVETPDTGEGEYVDSRHGRHSSRPELSLVFRKADGSGKGFAYSLFLGVEFDDPSVGFTINFSGCKVNVTGRNLEQLLRRVCEHRQAEIIEASEGGAIVASNSDPIIDSISFRVH